MTHQTREPVTHEERYQEQVEETLAREDEADSRSRFEPCPNHHRPCGTVGCTNPADGSGVFCAACWITIGPYDRPIDER